MTTPRHEDKCENYIQLLVQNMLRQEHRKQNDAKEKQLFFRLNVDYLYISPRHTTPLWSHFIFEAAMKISRIYNLGPFSLQTNGAYVHFKNTCQPQIIVQIPSKRLK